jgi:hypothetical protein
MPADLNPSELESHWPDFAGWLAGRALTGPAGFRPEKIITVLEAEGYVFVLGLLGNPSDDSEEKEKRQLFYSRLIGRAAQSRLGLKRFQYWASAEGPGQFSWGFEDPLIPNRSCNT